MRITRGLLVEWLAIPEDYYGPIVLHCAEGAVKKIEYTVTKKPDNLHSVSPKTLLASLDKSLTLTVERKVS